MVLIILSHFCVHSNFNFDETTITFNRVFVQFFSLGEVGVDCFVIISGYFLVKSTFLVKKAIKLIGTMWFYSVSILIIMLCLYGPSRVDNMVIVKSVIPIYDLHWFAYAYLVLYIITPMLNKFFHSLSQQEMLKMISFQMVVWGIMPIFFYADMEWSVLIWFICLYTIGAYIRLYLNYRMNIKTIIRVIIYIVMLLLFAVVFVDILSIMIGNVRITHVITRLYATNSIFIISFSVCLFLLFKNIHITYNSYINRFATTMFGVYLIHDNPLVRSIIWTSLFNNFTYRESDYLCLIAIVEVLVVLIVCSCCDYVRMILVEKSMLYHANILFDKIYSYIYKSKKWFYLKLFMYPFKQNK